MAKKKKRKSLILKRMILLHALRHRAMEFSVRPTLSVNSPIDATVRWESKVTANLEEIEYNKMGML